MERNLGAIGTPEDDDTDFSTLPKISKEAAEALVIGVKRGDHLVNLELLGLNQRTINLLEDKGIFTLKKILNTTSDTLLGLSNFGDKALYCVFLALSRYHLLDEKEKEVKPMIPERIVNLD